jgi:hypothetical protein
MKNIFLLSLLLLGACAGNYKAPSLSGNPQSMSAETLCFRYAGAKNDPAIVAEITARRLDCGQLLENNKTPGLDPYTREGVDVINR